MKYMTAALKWIGENITRDNTSMDKLDATICIAVQTLAAHAHTA